MDQKDKVRIKSALRKCWRWSAERAHAIKTSKPICANCKKTFLKKNLKCDHIIPVVSHKGFESWDIYIARMFPGAEGYQMLCDLCHAEKTARERTARNLNKKLMNKVVDK